MTGKTAGQRSTEGLSFKLSACAWIGGGLLSLASPSGRPLFLLCAAASIANLRGLRLCSTEDSYLKRGRIYAAKLRLLEAAAIAIASWFEPFRHERLWLLAVPLVIGDNLSQRSTKRCLGFAVAITLSLFLGNLTQNGSLNAGVVPVIVVGCASLVGEVLTKYRGREETLDARDRRMHTLMTTASAVAARDLRNTILRAVRSTVQDLGATAGLVTLVCEENRDLLRTEAAFSRSGEFKFPETIQVGTGLSGYVVKMGQPISVYAAEGEHLDCDGIDLDARAAVSVPLMTRGGNRPGQAYEECAIGSLTLLFCDSLDPVDQEDLALLQSLSSLLGAAVSNQRMEERQRLTFLRTLESLATALEARDDYTRGHSHRVCELSIFIGQRLGLGPEALEELRIGTTLHDIGKIGVPDAILNKPSRLTDEEFQVMREHPVIGYEICRPLMLSEGVLMIIRNHHEKLDGSGYPDGLKGGELPLSLRIVCVADAFDAMSSRRPYRSVMDIRHVLAELAKGAGVQFDPVVVESLRDLLQEGRLDDLYRQFWDTPAREAA